MKCGNCVEKNNLLFMSVRLVFRSKRKYFEKYFRLLRKVTCLSFFQNEFEFLSAQILACTLQQERQLSFVQGGGGKAEADIEAGGFFIQKGGQ